VPWAAAHVSAILHAWYPGEEGGAALADVLFGVYSPAGRLPVTVVRSAADLPPFADYSMRGRTYRYVDKEPLWTFGHGLGYAAFRYASLVVDPTAEVGGAVELTVEVENTSGRAADEVVEVYVSKPGAPAYAPRRWLAGFVRVSFAAHERKTVALRLDRAAMTIVDERGRRQAVDGDVAVAVGGRQPDPSWRFARSTDGVTARVHLRSGPLPNEEAR
jgi:beta-glucosidase